jgi:3-methyl-2-oxobutanoate hydroxymethyltransferase
LRAKFDPDVQACYPHAQMSTYGDVGVRRVDRRLLQKKKIQKEPIAMLTAYDAVTAALVEQAGVDLILVGDSLGNVVLGLDTTLPVTLEAMLHHTTAVVRGTQRAFVVMDLPFGASTDPETALRASVRALKETGCQGVKIEGGLPAVPTVSRLVEQGIPVMAHIGLTPQSIHQLGGYYKHGKSEAEADDLLKAARELQSAGAFALVLEMVVPEVAARISQELSIPTIGIGSGPDCDGQVLVVNDLIGLSLRPPPSFARPRADVASLIRQAVTAWVNEVRAKIEPPAPGLKRKDEPPPFQKEAK